MSRASEVRVLLLSVLALSGCRDFTVPRQPEVQDVTLEPAEAFGEQEIALRFEGKADLARVQVSIGGKLATLPEGQSGDGVVRAIVPRLSGTCEEQVPVQVSAPGFSFNAATLRYKGVGHPGNPRPTLSSQAKSVAFMPTGATVMYGEDGAALVASGHGEAVLVFPLGKASGQRVGAVYRKDFVLGLDTPGAGIIVDVTQHGEVEQFSLGNHISADVFAPTGQQGKETPPLLPDLASYLPSALSEPPSLAILPFPTSGDATSDTDGGVATRPPDDAGAPKIEDGDAGLAGPEPDAGPALANYRGMLLAATPAPKAFQVVADSTGLSTPGNDAVTGWIAGIGSSAAAMDDQTMAVFKGGAVPAVWVLDADGKGLRDAVPLASQGDEWTVAATTSAASGYALAYLQGSLGLDGRLLLVGRPSQTDPTACECHSPSPMKCRTSGNGYCLDTAGSCACVSEDDCELRDVDAPCVTVSGELGACVDLGGLKGCVAEIPSNGCFDSGSATCMVGGPCDLGFGATGECAQDAVGGCSCAPKQSDIPCAYKQECGGPCSDGEGSGTCVPDSKDPLLCVCDPGPSSPDADGGRLPPPPVDDAGTGGKGGAGGEDAGLPSVVDLPMHGPALTSLAADPVKNVVYGVDGVSTWLYAFSISASPLALEAGQSVPLPEPGVRVLAVLSASGAQPVVIGRSGRIFQGPEYSAQRIRLGLSSVSPRLRSSCEAPQAVVAASEIGATVVVPTAEGPAAFLEGAPGARFADTVAFGRDGGLPLAYFYSGGAVPPQADPLADAGTGFVVSQTSAQTYGLSPDGGLPKKSEFHFSARAATAILTGDETATLVVGSPEGIRFVPMEAGELPQESAATLAPQCPDVRRLVPLGEGSAKVFVQGHREQKADGTFDQLLCLADASTKSADVATVQLPVSAIAAASTVELVDGAATKRVHRLYTVGWEVPAGGTALVLTVRHVDAAASAPLEHLEPLEWGPQARELLPTGGAPISALAVSPDGRRLLVALAGDKPGVLAIDPAPFLNAGSEAEKAAALTTLWLPATPVGIGFTADGARAVIALSDDTLAFVE